MNDGTIRCAPHHVLCVLTADTDLAAIGQLGEKFAFRLDTDYSRYEPAPEMREAFAGCADGTFTDADHAAVAAHRAVAYLTSGRFLPPELTTEISGNALTLTGALFDAGALAVKHESSVVARGRDRWRELAAAGDPVAQREAWVRLPLRDGDVLYTCGMHLLGQPDVEVEHDGDPTRIGEWVELMETLADYVLTEERAAEMAPGQGFRLAPDEPRWVLDRTGCDRYDEDDLSHNPYGYWRLREDDPAGTGPSRD